MSNNPSFCCYVIGGTICNKAKTNPTDTYCVEHTTWLQERHNRSLQNKCSFHQKGIFVHDEECLPGSMFCIEHTSYNHLKRLRPDIAVVDEPVPAKQSRPDIDLVNQLATSTQQNETLLRRSIELKNIVLDLTQKLKVAETQLERMGAQNTGLATQVAQLQQRVSEVAALITSALDF